MASAGARHTFIVRSSAACGKTLLGKCPGANAYRPPAGLRAQPARHTQWLRIGRHYLVPGRDLESGRHPQARWPCGPAVVYLWTPKAALGVGFGGFADFHRGEKLLRRLSAVFFTRAGPGLPEGRGVCGGSRGGVRMASVPNWRRRGVQYVCPGCLRRQWQLQTRRAWQIPRCELCGLLMLAVGSIRGWRGYRSRSERSLRPG